MAEVDFGDSELFEQLDDSAPRVSKHIRFTDDEEGHEEISHLRNRLEECDDYIQRLIEENILVGGAQSWASTVNVALANERYLVNPLLPKQNA